MSNHPAKTETLNSLRQALIDSLDENLVSVIHYAKEAAKIQVLIVVKCLEQSDWSHVSSAFDQTKGRAMVEPILLTEHSLKSSTDVFPILIRDIKKGYQVIHGEDPVVDLQVHREHLRLRCEQELRSLQIGMQSICLMHFASPHRLRSALPRDYESFLKLLKVAFELASISFDSDVDLIQTFVEKFELEEGPLLESREFAEGRGKFDEETFGNAYVALMAAVRVAANFADQLPEA